MKNVIGCLWKFWFNNTLQLSEIHANKIVLSDFPLKWPNYQKTPWTDLGGSPTYVEALLRNSAPHYWMESAPITCVTLKSSPLQKRFVCKPFPSLMAHHMTTSILLVAPGSSSLLWTTLDAFNPKSTFLLIVLWVGKTRWKLMAFPRSQSKCYYHLILTQFFFSSVGWCGSG